MATFTHRQGRFPAFIHLSRLLHKQGLAELDMVKFFLTREEYLRDEDAHVETVLAFLQEAGCGGLVPVGVENHDYCPSAPGRATAWPAADPRRGPRRPASKVLDVACGPGLLALHLAEAGGQVASLDIAPAICGGTRWA